jgi:three-Cys-motif partner protein
MAALGDHEFGSQHTDLKLSVIESYLKAFTIALSGKFPKLWYIDAFAGTGRRTVRVAARDGDLFDEPAQERVEQRRGSAQIAIDIVPMFDRLVFVDANPRHCAALRALREKYSERTIDVIENDANDAIANLVRSANWRDTRAVMFLDRNNCQFESNRSLVSFPALRPL